LKGVELGFMTLSLMRKSDFYKSNISGVEIIEVLKQRFPNTVTRHFT